MLKQKSLLYRMASLMADVIVCLASLGLTYVYVVVYHDPQGQITSIKEFKLVFIIYVILCPSVTIFFAYITRLYESLRLKSYFELILASIQALAMTMVFLTAVMAILGSQGAGILTEEKRKLIPLHWMGLVYCVSGLTLIMSEKLLAKFWLSLIRRRARNIRRILIVGTGERALRLDGVIDFHKHWGLHIVGFVTLGGRTPPSNGENANEQNTVSTDRIIGDVAEIAEIIDRYIVDEVIFAITLDEAKYLEKAIEKCEEVGISFHLVADFLDTTISKVEHEKIGNISLLSFSSAPQNLAATFAKRLFDIFISTVLLLTSSIVTIPVAIIIKLTSKGQILFKQERVGLNGRVFTLYKFRSMVSGAEKMQHKLMDQNVMTGPVFKIQKDPRVTRVGRFIRKWSIDELPQLLNVFVGQMSIIGPRPLPTYEVEKLERWQRRRLSMKPGLTCTWQTEGRSKITDFDDWMKLDLLYIDNWTFGLDIVIFLRTIPVVLFGKGAH